MRVVDGSRDRVREGNGVPDGTKRNIKDFVPGVVHAAVYDIGERLIVADRINRPAASGRYENQRREQKDYSSPHGGILPSADEKSGSGRQASRLNLSRASARKLA